VRREFNPAFVMTRTLRLPPREPTSAASIFWVNKLNQFNGDLRPGRDVKASSFRRIRERFTSSDALPEAFFEFGDKTQPKRSRLEAEDPARIARPGVW